MNLQLSIGDRFHGAWRILTGRGDDATVCSFCGKNRHDDANNIVAGPGVAICGQCIEIASKWKTLASVVPEDGMDLDSFDIWEDQASLLPHVRQELDALFQNSASQLSSTLISWGYARGYPPFADGLSVFVQRPAYANTEIYRNTFIRMLIWGPHGEGMSLEVEPHVILNET